MFRKVSYSIMVATLFLSWGLMLRVAYTEDRTAGDSGRTAAIVNIAPAYSIPQTEVSRPVAAPASAIKEELPRVIHKTTTATTIRR